MNNFFGRDHYSCTVTIYVFQKIEEVWFSCVLVSVDCLV